MNRNFKFRVWDVLNKELIYTPNKQFTIRLDGEVVDGEGRYYDEIYPIQQYIGIDDINGTPIYEGDYVRCGVYKPTLVTYDKEVAGFYPFYLLIDPERGRLAEKPEVIGNIFENKELL